jgi:hypothetical protein
MILDQARQQGLANVAQNRDLNVESFGPTLRRAQARFGQGGPQPPELPVVGRSAPLIDGIFDFASGLMGGETPIADMPQAERINAEGLKAERTLVLYQVNRYDPAARGAYESEWQSPTLRPTATQWALGNAASPNPLSLAAIKQRTGFKPAGGAGDDQQNGGANAAQ